VRVGVPCAGVGVLVAGWGVGVAVEVRVGELCVRVAVLVAGLGVGVRVLSSSFNPALLASNIFISSGSGIVGSF